MGDKINLPAISRRDVFSIMAGAVVYALVGCPSSSPNPNPIPNPNPTPEPSNRYSTTGVPGLNTPQEILSNPAVNNTIQSLSNSVNFIVSPLVNSINPPNIEGNYKFKPSQKVPYEAELNGGDLTWSNQTVDNKIQTDYRELLTGAPGSAVGISRKGEIIRGEQSGDFTVYSVLDQTWYIQTKDITCEFEGVIIIDGEKLLSGNIVGSYFGVPNKVISGPCQFSPVAGLITFNRTKAGEKSAEDFDVDSEVRGEGRYSRLENFYELFRGKEISPEVYQKMRRSGESGGLGGILLRDCC